jgi:hypothetical protein
MSELLSTRLQDPYRLALREALSKPDNRVLLYIDVIVGTLLHRMGMTGRPMGDADVAALTEMVLWHTWNANAGNRRIHRFAVSAVMRAADELLDGLLQGSRENREDAEVEMAGYRPVASPVLTDDRARAGADAIRHPRQRPTHPRPTRIRGDIRPRRRWPAKTSVKPPRRLRIGPRPLKIAYRAR